MIVNHTPVVGRSSGKRPVGSLRPRRLDHCVGQDEAREQLQIAVTAATRRGEHLDHVLLDGPPGLGKTTLARVVATELGADMLTTGGPALARPSNVMSILTQLAPGSVLFIDEIHRLPKPVEEFLYPAIEDFRVDCSVHVDGKVQNVRLELEPFTLIGATTRAGMLSAPLRDRFGIHCHLRYYTKDELGRILERSARLLGISTEPDVLRFLASRSRGTPRIANRLLRRIRDIVEVREYEMLTTEGAIEALSMLQIDAEGLDQLDRDYLRTILDRFDGGPVGIEAVAASMGYERDTLEDAVEPYLLQTGFLSRSPRGRVLQPKAVRHLGGVCVSEDASGSGLTPAPNATAHEIAPLTTLPPDRRTSIREPRGRGRGRQPNCRL